jgi:hypothetical protein
MATLFGMRDQSQGKFSVPPGALQDPLAWALGWMTLSGQLRCPADSISMQTCLFLIKGACPTVPIGSTQELACVRMKQLKYRLRQMSDAIRATWRDKRQESNYSQMDDGGKKACLAQFLYQKCGVRRVRKDPRDMKSSEWQGVLQSRGIPYSGTIKSSANDYEGHRMREAEGRLAVETLYDVTEKTSPPFLRTNGMTL